MNYKRIYAIQNANKKRIIKHFGNVPETSGIYILTRDSGDFKYSYIGQAKNLLERLAGHLNGYISHIDTSIKKHGLYDSENKHGWKLEKYLTYSESELDDRERFYIRKYVELGYIPRNKTSGGQDGQKRNIETPIRKGYQQGLQNGYDKARKEIQELLSKVQYTLAPRLTKSHEPAKNSIKALHKIIDFLELPEKYKNDF